MNNNKIAYQLKLLACTLVELVNETVTLQHDLRELGKERSEEVGSIIDSVRRDALMMKDNLHRVRRKLFN